MADKKNNQGEDMSVDELVNLLRDNISSADVTKDDSNVSENKTISRKADPDKDIAAMLKKFMPEEENSEDFELDDAIDELSDNDDFELESDAEASQEITGDSVEDEFEIDDNTADIYGADFDEPSEYVLPDFEAEDDSIMDDMEVEEVREEDTPKRKKLGGLFSFGKQKQSGLAEGYAKMLENELSYDEVEKNEDISEKDYADLMEDEEMPELNLSDDKASENLPEVEDDTAKVESEPIPGQMFVLDNKIEENEPEDDYFVNEKRPLAFDDEDETPIVPDVSAFSDVPSSDATPEDLEDSDEVESEVSAENLDDKDINLMIALGYEDELEKAIGKKNVEEFSDQLNAEIVDFIDTDSAYAFDGLELNSPDRFRAVGDKYKHENFIMKMRLFSSIFFAAALFLFEFLGMFGVTLGGALNIHHYPVVGIMISLQFLVLAASLSFKQIFDGLMDAITFKPSPSSVPAVAVLLTVIYDIIMALIAPNTGLNLYNFPAALCIVFMVLSDYFNLSREIRAFHTIATRRPKYAVTPAAVAERSAEDEMMALFADDDNDRADEKILNIGKAGFIDNYFRRTNIRSLKSRNICLLIFPFIALSIALGILSYVTNKSGVTAFNVSILTVLFGMPMSSVFIYSYPFFSAAKTAFENDAAIIGEVSLEEYSDATTVVFADKEVFPVESTVTKGIKLYDNNAIYYVLYHLTSLYSKIGGPLKTRLVQATAEMGHSEDVEVISVAQKGIEAIVDGKVRVLAGQASFMEENGIQIGFDPEDEQILADGAVALYLVLDGVLSAKLYVNYEIDPDFENVISILASENMECVIRTCDPNVDDELLAAKLRVSRFPARIVKCNPEDNADAESVESGIVARNSLMALSHTITLCNKIRRVRKTGRTVSVISMIVSAAMMVFLALFSSKISVPSVYVALYQIFWMIPMFLFTKLYVK